MNPRAQRANRQEQSPGPAQADPREQALSFEALSKQNRSRCDRWHAEGEPWGGADWSNAMCGEAGEVANVVKKLRRHESGVGTSYNTPPEDELRAALAEEIADVILYADLLAYHYGVELVPVLIAKFNRVSEVQGFPERLSVAGAKPYPPEHDGVRDIAAEIAALLAAFLASGDEPDA